MACIIVPTAVGIVTTAFRKKFPSHLHINWLNIMVFGGAMALGVEHIIHGEIVPWPPFLTAMSNPADTAEMLGEMAIIGIPMTLALIFAWIVMVVAYEKLFAKSSMMVFCEKKLKNYRLDFLGLMLGGTFIMVLVDNLMKMLGGEAITNDIVPGTIMLAVLMIAPLFAVWMVAVGYERLQTIRATG